MVSTTAESCVAVMSKHHVIFALRCTVLRTLVCVARVQTHLLSNQDHEGWIKDTVTVARKAYSSRADVSHWRRIVHN